MTIEAEREGFFVDLVFDRGGMPMTVRVTANAFAALVDAEVARRQEESRIANTLEPIDV